MRWWLYYRPSLLGSDISASLFAKHSTLLPLGRAARASSPRHINHYSTVVCREAAVATAGAEVDPRQLPIYPVIRLDKLAAFTPQLCNNKDRRRRVASRKSKLVWLHSEWGRTMCAMRFSPVLTARRHKKSAAFLLVNNFEVSMSFSR